MRPDRRADGSQAALGVEEEPLLRPGVVTQLHGFKQVLSGPSPAVSMDRNILSGYTAKLDVGAKLETAFAADRMPLVQTVKDAIKASPPQYIGPRNERTDYLIGTAKSIFENPEHYADISPELRAAITAYNEASDRIMGRVVSEYDVGIAPFSVDKPDWAYLATVQTRESLDDSLKAVSEGYTSSTVTGKTSVAKRRV